MGPFYLMEELTCIVDYEDAIERMIEEEPDRRTKEHRAWKEEINKLIEAVNKMALSIKSPKLYNTV